ncbi:MAG: alpha/beta hydrolase [Desulfobulbaceae bacterium]|nr:alpha/beta hydrolase [Desulfobulbaceae bacterium]
MARRLVWLTLALVVLAGCTPISPQQRRENAVRLAAAAGWREIRLPAERFILAGFIPQEIPLNSKILTIYIEGDGLAWLTSTRISSDPTPVNPIGLELALRHPQGPAAYLARPCQYVTGGDARGCTNIYWSDRRFSLEVVSSVSLAIDRLKQEFRAQDLQLVGYSGGGAIAALVAARRSDVTSLITVAGNLDHQAWTRKHGVPPLSGSLNPADEWQAISTLQQIHFVGGRDTVISSDIFASFASHFPARSRPELVIIPDADHVCCWVERWPQLYESGGGR